MSEFQRVKFVLRWHVEVEVAAQTARAAAVGLVVLQDVAPAAHVMRRRVEHFCAGVSFKAGHDVSGLKS